MTSTISTTARGRNLALLQSHIAGLLTLPGAAAEGLRDLLDALPGWWQRLWMDERAAYLSQADDHADLERRLRCWNDICRRNRSPLIAGGRHDGWGM